MLVSRRTVCVDTTYGEDITREYVRALEARRVPHVLSGGRSFHAREEVIALRAVLSALEWPEDALHVYAHVGLLELLDRLTAAVTLGEHREHVARELLQLRVVGSPRQHHERYSSPPSGRPPAWSAWPSTVTASASSAYGKQNSRAKVG